MGDDYSTLQVFVGREPFSKSRQLLKQTIITFLETRDFINVLDKEHIHNRVIAIGPADSSDWIAVYDSISYLDEGSEFELLYSFEDFVYLTKAISEQFNPAVKIIMDDSCSVGFELFVGGNSIDRYRDSPGIGWLVHVGEWTEEQRRENAGKPEVWVENLQLEPGAVERLKRVWLQRDVKTRTSPNSLKILDDTAEILGCNKYYCSTGYNIGADGVPFNYKVPFSYWGFDEFEELYFFKKAV
jgi:hypothetical protein